MRKIIGFIFDNRDWFSLLSAIILSLTLLNTNDSSNIQIIRGKTNSVFAIFFAPGNWLKDISTLKNENINLKNKVLQLSLFNSELLHYKNENEGLRNMLDYKNNTNLSFIPGKVTSKGLSPLITAMTINVGSGHYLSPNLAVINVEGVVGKTISISSQTALVQLLTDYSFRLSVKIQEAETVGILRWRTGNIFEVWEIPRATKVNIGDRIVTSGYSDIFPPNLPVGKVTNIIDRPDMLHKIAIGSAYVDFNKLGHIFVIDHYDE
ncbi:MAG: rod shape-determining protein MreC [Candidatus Neomarinimicrobiota bacterium]